jgi:transcriptional regulator with XRE-family HTH domain
MGVKDVIKIIREKTGWTPSELARASGISKQMIHHWQKHGASHASIKHLIKLQEVSGLSVAQFWKLLKDEHGALDE